MYRPINKVKVNLEQYLNNNIAMHMHILHGSIIIDTNEL